MNYEQSIAYIHGKYGKGVKEGLRNTRRLLERMGDPQNQLRCIHVAGTNGKGSTCAMLDSVLRLAGYSVGLYTSPFLMRYNERICVDGQAIPDEDVAHWTTRIRQQADEMERMGEGYPTVFELGTVLMFCYFAHRNVDFAVIEVGLGGRLDPTNVIKAAWVTVITRIGLDHCRVLGETVQAIAGEKAGIIKHGCPVVMQAQTPQACTVVAAHAREMSAEWIDMGDFPPQDVMLHARGASFVAKVKGLEMERYTIALCGAHQVDNALTALGALGVLRTRGVRLPLATVREGLAQAVWTGRLEWLGDVLLDGAHNPQGAQTVCDYLHAHYTGARIHLVCGIMADKAVDQIVDCFACFASVAYCVRPGQMERAEDAQQLAQRFADRGVDAHACTDTHSALAQARAACAYGELVLVCGSLYLVGEARYILTKEDCG